MKKTRDKFGRRQIEKVEHGPFCATIRMDDMGVFSCEYGGLRKSGTLPEVREWARVTLRDLCNMKWQPVMAVNFDNEDIQVNNLCNSSNIACYIERFWISWVGHKWIECPWVVDRAGSHLCIGPANSEREQEEMPEGELQAQRIGKSRDFYYGPPSPKIDWPLVSNGLSSKIYHIPYTEEHWQTMLGILEKIRELRSGINRLLGSTSGWLVLAQVAASRMLPAPSETEDSQDFEAR